MDTLIEGRIHTAQLYELGENLIPFSKPDISTLEIDYVSDALKNGPVQNGGSYTKAVEEILLDLHPTSKAIIATTSGTSALEMAARLARSGKLGMDLEIIVPSFAFSSCANAVYAAGCIPVYADIDLNTLSISLEEVQKVVTKKTIAIMVINYSGVGRDLMELRVFCDLNGLLLIEDNAHGLGAKVEVIEKGVRMTKTLGTIGHLSATSFHATKNIIAGEGGALVINNEELIDQAFTLKDKGTNRRKFLLGQTDKYTWVSFGSSYGLSDVNSAVLKAQLERMSIIQQKRRELWFHYYRELMDWANELNFRFLNSELSHNSHIFWILTDSRNSRDEFLKHSKLMDVLSTFHYVPLHSSPFGAQFLRRELPNTDIVGSNLVRLPMASNFTTSEISQIIEAASSFRI